MESGLDHRLSRIPARFVEGHAQPTNSQSLANEILEELTARSITALNDQLDEATEKHEDCGQRWIVTSVSEVI